MDSFKASRRQNAFIFWNQPGWDRQQPNTTHGWNEQTRLYEEGYMQGIEVANGKKYSPETTLHRQLSKVGRSSLSFELPLSFEQAAAYRKANGQYVRKNQWRETTVTVYIDLD